LGLIGVSASIMLELFSNSWLIIVCFAEATKVVISSSRKNSGASDKS
jgi:hypothetical protein